MITFAIYNIQHSLSPPRFELSLSLRTSVQFDAVFDVASVHMLCQHSYALRIHAGCLRASLASCGEVSIQEFVVSHSSFYYNVS